MIDVNDPRVKAILAARQDGDWEAEKAATSGMELWMNNFYAVFKEMRMKRLNPSSSLMYLYINRTQEFGETWEKFVEVNGELLGEIDDTLGRFSGSIELSSFQLKLIPTTSNGLTREEALSKFTALDEATGHPLGIDATYYAMTDAVNPLLKRAWLAMEASGIEAWRFASGMPVKFDGTPII